MGLQPVLSARWILAREHALPLLELEGALQLPQVMPFPCSLVVVHWESKTLHLNRCSGLAC